MSNDIPIDEDTLEELYSWIDGIPLSRPKKNMTRDFSDGVMVAELVHHYMPKLVELHNYTPASKLDNKLTNWKILNRKVFKKLDFQLADDVVHSLSTCQPWAAEQTLLMLRRKIDRTLFEERRQMQTDKMPEADQVFTLSETKPKPGSQPGKSQTKQKQAAPGVLPGHRGKEEVVSKVHLEEKEQELLAKDETIQILNAKVRRLEHLLHLKDIRIDDLQGRIDRLEAQLKPTAKKGKN